MRAMRFAVAFFMLILLIAFPVAAENDDYSAIYEASGAGDLSGAIPKETLDYLKEFGIDPEESNWVDNLSADNAFSHIWKLISGGITQPIKLCGILIALILIASAFPAFSLGDSYTEIISVVSSAVAIASPVWSSISAAVAAIKASSGFMLSFVPIFGAIVLTSGAPLTSASMSALLLVSAEAVGAVAAFVILPVMGAYLSVSISSSVSPLCHDNSLSEGFKKLAFWILSFVTTVFIGILGIQTAVNSAADTVAMKAGKFLIGTVVPIGGAAISEAAGTISASLGLLRSSIGIYAVVVLVAMFLPIILELFLWRAALLLCAALAASLSLGRTARLLRSVDTMLSLLIGSVLLIAALFIISLSVVVSAGKSV